MTWTLVLALVAVWRLSRLAAVDLVMLWWRVRMERRHPMLGYLAQCPFCMSIWLSPFVITPAVLWPESQLLLIVVACLAASSLAGLLSTIEDRLDRADAVKP